MIAKFFDELTLTELYEILKSRQEVFVTEQKITCVDADDIDYKSLHCFFMDGRRVTAYLRAFYDEEKNGQDRKTVRIGRVLTLRHGNGLGRKLMEESLSVIQDKLPCAKIVMDAQKYAQGFYEKFGFRQTSGEYLEEGIVHIDMERDVTGECPPPRQAPQFPIP